MSNPKPISEEFTVSLIEDIVESQKQILVELSALKYGDAHLSLGEKLSDKITTLIGSWRFIILQSTALLIWILFNILAVSFSFDAYPFILLNLALSFQAAFATPIILMATNRSGKRDRKRAADAYRAIEHIESMMEGMAGSCIKLRNKVNGNGENDKDHNGQ